MPCFLADSVLERWLTEPRAAALALLGPDREELVQWHPVSRWLLHHLPYTCRDVGNVRNQGLLLVREVEAKNVKVKRNVQSWAALFRWR
jgi:hypothetical protein